MKQTREETETPLAASYLLRRLADIEEQGVLFYQGWLEGTKSEWVTKVASAMVRAEQRHHNRFLKYAARAEESEGAFHGEGSPNLPPDVIHVLSTTLFTAKAQIQKAAQYAGDYEMIEMAIRAEESLALLLTRLRQYVPKTERKYVNRVIKEEWAHHAKLDRLRRNHFSGKGDPR